MTYYSILALSLCQLWPLLKEYKASQRGPMAGRAVGRDGKAERGEQAGEEKEVKPSFFLPALALPSLGGASSALAQKESRRLAKAEGVKSLN